MRIRWLLLFVLVATVIGGVGARGQAQAASLPPAPADPAVPAACDYGALDSGALYFICVPRANWNGDVAIWNHGYIPPQLPVDFTTPGMLYFVDGIYIPNFVLDLGYAFAATTYRSNGLAALDGVADVRLLLERYHELHDPDRRGRVYLTGASMGGLVTMLLAEQYPSSFTGALAACGVVGDFQRQVKFWGDFRVLFDYFFPGVLPGSPIAIPDELIANWEQVYQPAVIASVSARPDQARQLIAVSKAPIDPARPAESTVETVVSLLAYNVFATNEGKVRLGGNPYDNRTTWYWGSANDWRLNRYVQRFQADPAALAALAKFDTTGQVRIPSVLPHTTGDQIVRFDQTLLYWLKARPKDGGSVLPIPIRRYGHCTFTAEELVVSFALVVLQSGKQLPPALADRVAAIDWAANDAELAAQLEAFEAAEAQDRAAQAAAGWPRAILPLVIR